MPRASIIICTRDRAAELQRTLSSLQRVHVPDDIPCELLIVDNGSTDDTAQVAQTTDQLNMPVHYIFEPRKGQCFARNTGVTAARGDVILFTDDDLRFPTHWIESMCRPILNGRAEAVAGGVKFAPHLERDWMTLNLRTKMAETRILEVEGPSRMVGANMAFSKAVLQHIPAFDLELGPGALGFADETLFSQQLLQAGCRIQGAFNVEVEHHFDPSRLTRASLLSLGERHGRSSAYTFHHWGHDRYRLPRLRLLYVQVLLAIQRALRPATSRLEYVPEWEMDLVEKVGNFHQYLIERRRPRNYTKYGLVKQHGLRDDRVREVVATR